MRHGSASLLQEPGLAEAASPERGQPSACPVPDSTFSQPGRKKQGRELDEKKRLQDDWEYGGRVAARALSWFGGTRPGHLLNHNPWIRIGPGRMPRSGRLPGGARVPRLSVGPQKPGVSNPHLDLRAWWEIR